MLATIATITSLALAQEPSAWGAEQIVSYLRSAPAPARPDPFTAAAPHNLSGQPIRLTFEVKQRQGYAGGFYTWDYDLKSQTLKLSALPDHFTLVNWPAEEREFFQNYRTFAGFSFGRTETETDGGTRSNAYGASVRVTTVDAVDFAIAEPGLGYDQPAPFGPSFMEASIPMDPEAARAATQDLQLVVDAVVTPLSDGRVVICGSSYMEPSIRNPIERVGKHCALTVDVTRISFERRSDGTVLKAWGPN